MFRNIRQRRNTALFTIPIFLGLIILIFALYLNNAFIGTPDSNRNLSNLTPLAVLGDSDSHSYKDSYDNLKRGGDYHPYTYNWLELWAHLADDEIYPGDRGVWGSHYRTARIKNLFMLKSRSPTKLDYEFNFAVSGLRCQSLLDDWPFQGKWLLNEINSNSEYWHDGIVIIKIGYNDIGKTDDLIKWKTSGLDQQASNLVSRCTESIIKMTDQILVASPTIKVAITGIARTYNFKDEWQEVLDENSIRNIESVLSEYDNRLKQYATDSTRVAYIDDHLWFNDKFGTQASDNLKTNIEYIDGIELINASGDEPTNILLKDHHTGTLYNGLWIRHMIDELNRQLKTKLTIPELHDVLKAAGLTQEKEQH